MWGTGRTQRTRRRKGKPVAVTEFGCTTHFASYNLPHRSDPREDWDMASYGAVKVVEDRRGHTYPNMAWEPKALTSGYRCTYSELTPDQVG